VSRGERTVSLALAGCTIGSLEFAVMFALGAPLRVFCAGIVFALICLTVALTVWAKAVIPEEEVREERESYPGPGEAREEIAEAFGGARDPLTRNGTLRRLLILAGGVLGVALLFPLRSFGRSPFPYRAHTSWRNGLRLVREDGTPVRSEELPYGSVLTVFPEGHIDDSLAQALLIRPLPTTLECYSKVCTHAGCPVALYRREAYELLCPCHQSAFAVLDGCAPVSGPAARPLPRLPIAVRGDGFVVATGDFNGPVGPDSWVRPV
jgi:ubiquinol-cytochrome c reductase iron-sulfur subunit